MKTIAEFIRNLQKEGLSKHASELKYLLAMSRERKRAEAALTAMTITLLIHLIKFISFPQARDKNKWAGEIKGYLNRFDIRNNHKGQAWLPIEYIKSDFNDVLSSPSFCITLERELENYPSKEKALSLLRANKNLRSLKVKMFYENENRLKISVNGIVL